jgi:hypothetical protein
MYLMKNPGTQAGILMLIVSLFIDSTKHSRLTSKIEAKVKKEEPVCFRY